MGVVALFAAALLGSPGGAAEPARLVSLAPSVTEMVFAVGAGEWLVGVTDFCDFPDAARKIERVGSYLDPSVEAVVARRPDLVIAVPSPGNEREVRAIESLGIPVVVVAEGPTLEDVYAAIRTIGEHTGRSEAAASVVRGMKDRVASVRARLEGRPPRPVLLVVDRSPLVVAGDATLLDELVRLAGGKNVAAGLGPWPRVGLEYVVRMQPEVILDGAMGPDRDAGLSFYQGLGLEAVERGRLHAIRIDEIMRPGPRLPAGVESLARQIHPEAWR